MKKILSRLESKKKTIGLHSKDAQQSQQLQETVDTNKLLDGKAGPVEGTKRSNTPALTENTPIRELWGVAYERLREDDGELIKKYETELKKSVAACLVQMAPAKPNQRDEMEAVLRAKMDEINKNISSPKFVARAGEFAQLFLKLVVSAKDYIGDAASTNPYTSIAWAGVSLLLPLLLNPSEQRDALAKGLDYITTLIIQSRMQEEFYIERYESKTGGPERFRQSHSEYKNALEKLYRQILRFQATAYCYSTHTSALRFAQDSVKWKSWEKLINDIRAQESNLAAIEEKWRNMQQYEERLAVESQHQATIDTLSAQLFVAQKTLETATEKEYDELLDWLCDIDHSSLYKAARDRHETGTNQWLIRDSEEFKTWETEQKSLLWLHGKAGSGKSILTSSVITYLRDSYASKSPASTALAYFYFSFSDAQKQKVEGMLASLLKQICSQLHGELLFTEHFRGYKKRGERIDTKTLEEMLLTSTTGFSNVYIVIDALDECPLLNGHREALLNSLGRIVTNASSNLHIFLTSRKEQDIDKNLRAFSSPSSLIEIDLLAEQQTLNRDICQYIELRLASVDFNSWPKGVKEEVKQSLMKNADCMFQYVRLQFEQLQKLSTTPQIRKALRDLPVGLDATYDRILQSIDSTFQDQVIGSLKWLAFSKRTLGVEEFAEIFTLYTASSSDGIFDEAERPFSSEDVLKYFSSLIVTSTDEVRLVHFSLREYLTSERVSEGATSIFSFNEVDSHLSIVRSCLVYLRHLSSQYSRGVRLECFLDHSDHLASYVARYWMVHLEEILDEKPEIAQEATPLLAANSQSLLTLLRINNSPRSLEKEDNMLLRPYCYTALLGLCRLTKLLISESINKYITQHDLGRALSIAASEGDTDMMQLLLEAGASPDVSGYNGTSLEAALRGGHINALELLEKHGTTIITPPARECSFKYNEELAKYLLDRGADINMQYEDDGTALHAAVSDGNERLFQLLLERGADVNAVHERLGTPLQTVCTFTNDYTTRFIKMLLDRGADPNVRGGRFDTALQAACAILSENHMGLLKSRTNRLNTTEGERRIAPRQVVMQNIQLLINHGADVNIQGGERGLALHALAASIEPETCKLIKLLLDKGAKVDQLSDADLGTALHVACYKGMPETVRLLLDSGADVNAAGGQFGTPLQAAVIPDWTSFHDDEEKNTPGREKERELILEIVELLLKRGAKINQRGGEFDSALQAACANRYVDMKLFRLLLDHGADINAEGGCLGTILAAACNNPKIGLEGARLLLDRGVDVNVNKGEFGTALMAACCSGQFELVRLLVDRGADVNAKTGNHATALIAACCSGQLELLRLLIDRGADVNAKTTQGQTALIIACSRESNESTRSMVELLLEKGAEVNAESEIGNTPLTLACIRRDGDVELVELLLENGANISHGDYAAWHGVTRKLPALPMLELLYNRVIDINHVHPEHGTVLNAIINDWCLDDGSELDPRIRWLLDHGANINTMGGRYGFPLQTACAVTPYQWNIKDINGSSIKTKFLLEHCPDIDINAQGGEFGSALQAAAFTGQTGSIKLLLDKKANVNATSGKYRSALNAAIISGYWDIVEILLQAGATPDCHLQQQPDEEWLEEIREMPKYDDSDYWQYRSAIHRQDQDNRQAAVERYMKFWEVQSKCLP
ncbi:ankyrin repeat-containing domain protein, partial [Trichoderma sp. TUCIM 5745]